MLCIEPRQERGELGSGQGISFNERSHAFAVDVVARIEFLYHKSKRIVED